MASFVDREGKPCPRPGEPEKIVFDALPQVGPPRLQSAPWFLEVVWRLASHSDRRMASLLWGQRLVDAVCRDKGVEHASALACCLESHTARSEDFDPVPCLLQLLAKEATSKIAANALCAWLSHVPAARLKFRDLRRLGPFLSTSTTADAICQAASCVLRDAACAIPSGDAASLIGPKKHQRPSIESLIV